MEISLYEPEIPPNTGNIARLCVCTSSNLHIVGKANFSLSDKAIKRAGLDYWDKLNLKQHKDWTSFLKTIEDKNLWLFSRFAKKSYTDVRFKKDDVLLFGSESKGLPKEIREEYQEKTLRIPVSQACRSLNLSNSVAIVLYEALRQLNFTNCQIQMD